jgi:hypothetical protein
MLVLALASPNFLGDELLVTLAFVRQWEFCPPVEAFLPEPFSFSVTTLSCPMDIPQDNPQDTFIYIENREFGSRGVRE